MVLGVKGCLSMNPLIVVDAQAAQPRFALPTLYHRMAHADRII